MGTLSKQSIKLWSYKVRQGEHFCVLETELQNDVQKTFLRYRFNICFNEGQLTYLRFSLRYILLLLLFYITCIPFIFLLEYTLYMSLYYYLNLLTTTKKIELSRSSICKINIMNSFPVKYELIKIKYNIKCKYYKIVYFVMNI